MIQRKHMMLSLFKNILIPFLFIIPVFFQIVYAEINFTANIDKTRLSLDDQMVLTIEASGKEVNNNMPEPAIPPDIPFRVVNKNASMSSSSSIQIIVNGKDMSRESEKKITWQYVLAPKAVGRFVLPSFVLDYQGKPYRTNLVTIEVIKEDAPNQDVIFEAIPEKRTVYIGEQFRMILRIGMRTGSSAANPKRPMFEDELRKYFWVENLIQGEIRGRRENINGVLYDVFDLPVALYPIQSGAITIPSFVLQYEERQAVRRRQGVFDDPFFNGFFGGVQSTPKQKVSRPVQLNVLNLPKHSGVFSGSVGRFNLSAKLDKTTLSAGDALTYTLTLTGNSSLRDIKDPILPSTTGFDVFEPEKKASTRIQNGIVYGTKEFKYVMIPLHEGKFTIQPTNYIYFDVDSKNYKTLTAPAFNINATPGKKSEGYVSSRSLLSHQEVKQLGQDIRFIKTGDIKMVTDTRPLHRNIYFLLLQILPIIVVFGTYIYNRQKQKLSEDIGYARRMRSKKQVRKRLSEAKKHLINKEFSQFYAALSKGIIDYIGDTLNIAAVGMTTDALKDILINAGKDKFLIDEIISLLEKADFARFATSTITQEEMEKDQKKAEDLLNVF